MSVGSAERYAAFVSYSHALDGALAPALQTSLEQFGRVWYKRRALRLFRDTTNLAATPHLWGSIERALRGCEWFVLLASPESARSSWVQREVDWWLDNRSAARMIVVVTAGSVAWDVATGRVDEHRTDALPPGFADRGLPEPLWIDLRELRAAEPTDPAFQTAIVDIAATLHGRPKDDLVGEQVRQHHLRRRSIAIVAMTLVLLTLTSIIAARVAIGQRNLAEEQARIATARLLTRQAQEIVGDDPRTALRLSEAAHRIHSSPETRAGLIYSMTNTRFQKSIEINTDSTLTAAFTTDGQILVTASTNGTIALWTLSDPARPHRLGEFRTEHTNGVDAMAVAPDGRVLATVGNTDTEGTLLLWDLKDPVKPTMFGKAITEAPIAAVTFAPDGGILATTGRTGTTILWDLTSPARPARLSEIIGHNLDGYGAAFSPNGRTLATAGANVAEDIDGVIEDATTLLWDVSDPAQPSRQGGPLDTDQVSAMAFTPTGRTLATATPDGTTFLWDLSKPALPRRLGDPLTGQSDAVIAAAFAPDGHTLATAGYNGTTILWDLSKPAIPRRLGDPLAGHTDPAIAVAFAPDGHTLVTASTDNTAILWNLDDPARPHSLGDPIPGHPGLATTVALAADGRTLATASVDDGVFLWDLTDPAHPRRLGDPIAEPPYQVLAIELAPDGRTMAIGGGDASTNIGTATLWDLTAPLNPARLGQMTGHVAIDTLAFAPDGRTLATASRDGTAILWDLTDPARPTPRGDPFTPHDTRWVTAASFAPDGLTLATAGMNGATRLWDLTDPAHPTPRSDPLTEDTVVDTVAFAPDGGTLATTSRDGTAILWDLTDPTHPTRPADPLTGHTDAVTAVAFTPDGRTLATISDDRTAILWDLTDPTHPVRLGDPLTGHTDPVIAVAFASDGRTLVTTSEIGTSLRWDIDVLNDIRSEPMERACAMTEHGLEPSEWARFVPDLPYLDSCA